MADGILWQLAGGGFDPGGSYASGLDAYNKRHTILQQLAGQKEDRQFRRETDARDFARTTARDAVGDQHWTQTYQAGRQDAGAANARADRAYNLQLKQSERGDLPQFIPNASHDQFGNPIGGFVDRANQKVTLVGSNGQLMRQGQSQQPVGQQSLPTGDAFLQTLDKPVADQVKALADGRMAFPSGFALKSPYWQHMIQAVSQYDPSFDAINYNARGKTRNDFTSGKSATQINAMNTVIGHLKSLSDSADGLNNTRFVPLNTYVNMAESAIGDPRYKQFDTTKKAVVDELTRVWRGNGGSEGDIKTWSDQINSANSPAQLHGVINQIGELLESKINAMGEQYKQGMGTAGNPIQLVTPQAGQVLKVLHNRAAGTKDSSSNGAGLPPGWSVQVH